MKTDIQQIAMTLTESLRRFVWFRFVGIGKENDEDIFIVYVSRRDIKKIASLIPAEWEGVPVVVRYMQQPVLAQTTQSDTLEFADALR